MSGELKTGAVSTNLIKGYNMLLYFTGSMIMNEPKEDCVIDFVSGGIMKSLPVSSSNPLFIKAASMLREPCGDREVCREMLISDFNRLFSSSGSGFALPLKSAYLGEKTKSGQAGSLTEFYSSYGWKHSNRENVPDDHLGVELLFLTKLTDKYLQLDDEPCLNEMRKEIVRFISEHLLDWLPLWNKKVQSSAVSPAYKGTGNMIQACAEDLYSLFGQRDKPL
jgi:TorA maturation chaperone TorD